MTDDELILKRGSESYNFASSMRKTVTFSTFSLQFAVLIITLHLVTSNTSSVQSPLPQKTRQSPCRFFVWDGGSAIRYNICKRLQTENTYEGLGGKMFVRIKPGSLLQSLYPLSRHSPDQCLLCGQSFRDHLKSWWFSRLYTPYDIYLDRVIKEFNGNNDGNGKVQQSGNICEGGPKSNKYGKRCKTRLTNNRDNGSDSSPMLPSSTKTYKKQYAKDLTEIAESKDRRKKKHTRKRLIDGVPFENFEQRKIKRNEYDINYTVPKFDDSNLGKIGSFILSLTRDLFLLEFDASLLQQHEESENILQS